MKDKNRKKELKEDRTKRIGLLGKREMKRPAKDGETGYEEYQSEFDSFRDIKHDKVSSQYSAHNHY